MQCSSLHEPDQYNVQHNYHIHQNFRCCAASTRTAPSKAQHSREEREQVDICHHLSRLESLHACSHTLKLTCLFCLCKAWTYSWTNVGETLFFRTKNVGETEPVISSHQRSHCTLCPINDLGTTTSGASSVRASQVRSIKCKHVRTQDDASTCNAKIIASSIIDQAEHLYKRDLTARDPYYHLNQQQTTLANIQIDEP